MSPAPSLPVALHEHLLKDHTNQTHLKTNLTLDELQTNNCRRLFIVNRQTTKRRENPVNVQCGRLGLGLWGANSEVEIRTELLKRLGTRLGEKTKAESRTAGAGGLPSANRKLRPPSEAF